MGLPLVAVAVLVLPALVVAYLEVALEAVHPALVAYLAYLEAFAVALLAVVGLSVR